MTLNQNLKCPFCKEEFWYEINSEKLSEEKLIQCSAETGSCGEWFVLFFETEHHIKLAKVGKPR